MSIAEHVARRYNNNTGGQPNDTCVIRDLILHVLIQIYVCNIWVFMIKTRRGTAQLTEHKYNRMEKPQKQNIYIHEGVTHPTCCEGRLRHLVLVGE